MHRINRIKIGGFRRLREVDLPVRPLMVLIGANGVGKTSFLDAFSLLSASAAGGLNKKLNDLGGVSNILTRDKTDEMSFLVEMDMPGQAPLNYEFALGTRDIGYSITRETLSQSLAGHSDADSYSKCNREGQESLSVGAVCRGPVHHAGREPVKGAKRRSEPLTG